MLYEVLSTKQFKKSLKKLKRSGSFNLNKLVDLIDLISEGKQLPLYSRDHFLKGKMKDYKECHVEPDLLLIYILDAENKQVRLISLGSHSELFG